MPGSGEQPGRPGQEVIVNERRARELVACERTRVESALAKLGGEIRDEGSLGRQQTGEYEIRQLSRGRICLRRPRGRPPRTARRRRARRGAHRTGHLWQIGPERAADSGRETRSGTACGADDRGAATPRNGWLQEVALMTLEKPIVHRDDAESPRSRDCATPTRPSRALTKTSADGWPSTRTAGIPAGSKAS